MDNDLKNLGKEEQGNLFPDHENSWQKEWHDMPEFIQENKEPIKQLIVSFETFKDYQDFAKLIGQNLTSKTRSVWFPKAIIDRIVDKKYIDEESQE